MTYSKKSQIIPPIKKYQKGIENKEEMDSKTPFKKKQKALIRVPLKSY